MYIDKKRIGMISKIIPINKAQSYNKNYRILEKISRFILSN